MAGSVSRLPNGTAGDGNEVPPLELYKIAVDEYRFQAQFNWTRTQSMLVFNTAVLAAGTAVASRPGHGAALVFGLGVFASVVSVFVVRTQHDYYRAARDRMRRVEEAAGIAADQRMDTTATLGQRRRGVSVNELVYLLLSFLAVSHAIGVTVVILR